MKIRIKKNIMIILIVVFVIYSIITTVLLFSVNSIEFPETEINIRIKEITTEEAIIYTTITISNTNIFDMFIRDMKIITSTVNGSEVNSFSIKGGRICSNTDKTFISNNSISFDGKNPDLLKTQMSAEAGFNIFGFDRVLPLSMNVISSLEDIVEDFKLPIVNIGTNFKGIDNNEIRFDVEIQINNINSFELYLKNSKIIFENEEGENLGKIILDDSNIKAESSKIVGAEGNLMLQALNYQKLFVKFNAEVGLLMAGIDQSREINTQVEISVPNIEELIPSDKKISSALRSDSKITIKGFISDVTFEVNNPTKINFVAQEILIEYYRIDNNEKTLLANTSINGGNISPEGKTFFKGNFLIPFSKVQWYKFIPDWYFIQIWAKMSLPGVNQSMWIGVSSYIDVHMLT
ncbi:MAG: hypothetical protein JXA91_04045 [Candidatus Thermoplasmatota archaeon]|nr:hypothetical protein [Candidatus Thermoplasmatota archaeon]